jgi:hypothetical protein
MTRYIKAQMEQNKRERLQRTLDWFEYHFEEVHRELKFANKFFKIEMLKKISGRKSRKSLTSACDATISAIKKIESYFVEMQNIVLSVRGDDEEKDKQ